ncbi:hypothetical protein [Pollutibacter soli]|uniref:hypothetical protein n=1 Tax=Pollutibacter soli TaxID=3034157 RepID=UPI003013505C
MNTSSFAGNVGKDLILSIHTVGVQLGYQFIFWKRLAVDFIMFGPGVGMYNLKAGINTES